MRLVQSLTETDDDDDDDDDDDVIIACDCDTTGAERCDDRSGVCQCWPNVVGRRCDQCAVSLLSTRFSLHLSVCLSVCLSLLLRCLLLAVFLGV